MKTPPGFETKSYFNKNNYDYSGRFFEYQLNKKAQLEYIRNGGDDPKNPWGLIEYRPHRKTMKRRQYMSKLNRLMKKNADEYNW